MAFALSERRLNSLVQGRVYKVVAPQEVAQFPYLVFASDSLEEAETKDGLAYDTSTVAVTAYGRTLIQAERAADLARRALRLAWRAWNTKDTMPPFTIEGQTFRAGPEDYDLSRDCYYLEMSLTIETAPTHGRYGVWRDIDGEDEADGDEEQEEQGEFEDTSDDDGSYGIS